ncbi:MAG: hypothetical protein ACRDRT_18800, partial [Pseudonocardiaceae bacterium]
MTDLAQRPSSAGRDALALQMLFWDRFRITGEGRRVIATDVELAEGVVIYQPDLVNLYGCR